MKEEHITFPDFPNNTPEHHLVEEVRNLHSMLFNSLVPTIDRINTTMVAYTKSTERLSRNTF